MSQLPLFIDFEASGLSGDSYPIEVGWNDPDGTVFSQLIHTESVAEWTHWDPDAERDAHQISRDQLERLGDPPKEIAIKMNETLAGRTLYSDALDYDQFWLERLYQAVGLNPTFTLACASELFLPYLAHDNPDPKAAEDPMNLFYEFLDQKSHEIWASLEVKPHRAAHDVRFLMEAYKAAAKKDA